MKQSIIITLIIVGALYLGGRYVYYGSLTRNCSYTENVLPAPEQLTKGELVIAKDAYLAIGKEKEDACLKYIGSIDRLIFEPETIDTRGGRQHYNYYTDWGYSVESLKKGTSFQIVNVISVTPHGLAMVGGGPMHYLILKDQSNKVYRIATPSLGLSLNKEELFLSFEDPTVTGDSSTIKLLSSDSFDKTRSYEGVDSATYNGKLTELSSTYLESTVPHWKKLSDRLERGEKFDIMVVIELRDADSKEIKLSDNHDERFAQIAQIQDEFLEKIPSSLVLKDVERHKSLPYVSMEANLDLLTYLLDRQVDLKIESISELIRLP